jgi:expansin (peptidoglycan-binding protein)
MTAASSQITGTATHYVLPASGGNCSYPGPPADGLYVALSPSEYDGAAACGGYLEVTGPDGSVRVEVVDQCPPCQAGHIDLSETAFARLAPLSAGLIHVTYRTIADPPLPGPVSLRVKEGSSPYWLALLPMNTGNPVASVEVKSSSHGWQELARASFNYWIASSGLHPARPSHPERQHPVTLSHAELLKAGRHRPSRCCTYLKATEPEGEQIYA